MSATRRHLLAACHMEGLDLGWPAAHLSGESPTGLGGFLCTGARSVCSPGLPVFHQLTLNEVLGERTPLL